MFMNDHREKSRANAPALFRLTAGLLILCGLTTQPAHAQGHTQAHKTIATTREVPVDNELGFRDGSFVAAPIPFSNPLIGAGLALGLGYLFKTTPDTKTSVIGVGGLKSDNGSQVTGVMFNLALDDNRWQVNSFFGKGDIKYDLYLPLSVRVPLRQEGTMGRLSGAYGVTPDLSFGIATQYLDTTVTQQIGSLPPEIAPDLGLELLEVGLTADWDKSNDSDYPTKGFRITAEATNGQDLSGTRNYYRGHANVDYYRGFGDNSVLALRGSTCAAVEDTPFFYKCALGGSDNFRGFNQTEFLSEASLSFQAEFRQRFTRRLGGVAFVGTGWTGDDFGSLTENGSRSAGGVGLRFRLSRKFPVDFSVDYSYNDQDEGLLYIYVGQRF